MFFLLYFSYLMVSGDSVDWMVDSVDDLSEVRQNSPEQATRPAPFNDLGEVREIALEQELVVAAYTFELG